MRDYKYCPYCSNPLSTGWIESRNRIFCPNCDFIHYENPLPTVAALAVQERRILLIKRGKEPRKGIWTLPSGFIEKGEDPEIACLRELSEETSMTGRIEKLLNAYHVGSTLYGDLISLVYLVRLDPGQPQAGDDADDAALFPIENISDLGFASFNKALHQFLKDRNGSV